MLGAGPLHDTDASGWRAWFDASGAAELAVAEGPVFEDFNLLRAALAGQGVASLPARIIADERDLRRGGCLPRRRRSNTATGYYVTQRTEPDAQRPDPR